MQTEVQLMLLEPLLTSIGLEQLEGQVCIFLVIQPNLIPCQCLVKKKKAKQKTTG